jgi:hypothetical protein
MQQQSDEIINRVNDSASKVDETVSRVQKATSPKNRRVQFVDDDNAEIIGDDGSVTKVAFPKEPKQ